MYTVLYAIRWKYALLTCNWTLQQHCPIVWNSVHYIQSIPCIISLIWKESCHPSHGIVAVRVCICVLLNVSVYSCMGWCVCAWVHARAYAWQFATSPKFAKSRNSNSLVSCGTDSSRDIGSIWICTVQIQIDGLVRFEFVLRNAVSGFGRFWGCSISSGSCHTKAHICICTRNIYVFMYTYNTHVCACVSTSIQVIAYLRIMRPGSIIGPQQQYLCAAASRLDNSSGARQSFDTSGIANSAALAKEVREGMLRRHVHRDETVAPAWNTPNGKNDSGRLGKGSWQRGREREGGRESQGGREQKSYRWR